MHGVICHVCERPIDKLSPKAVLAKLAVLKNVQVLVHTGDCKTKAETENFAAEYLMAVGENITSAWGNALYEFNGVEYVVARHDGEWKVLNWTKLGLDTPAEVE